MKIEIRNDSVLIKGYINAVERDSRTIQTAKETFVEQVRAGTWDKAIKKNNDIALLLNHDWKHSLGSTKDNLTLKEDNIGLYAEARVTDSSVIQKAKDSKLVGWSFGFKTNKHSWGKTDNDIDRRYLDDIDLFEVSILDDTKTPAYYGTSVETRDNKEVCIEFRVSDESIETIDNSTDTKELENKLKLLKLELEI